MGNNQDKKLAAAIHEADKRRKSPKLHPDFKLNGKIVDLGDMIEATVFDLEKMTFERRYDSILNGRKHSTIHIPPLPMEDFNEANDLLLRAQVRDEFNTQAEAMVLIN